MELNTNKFYITEISKKSLGKSSVYFIHEFHDRKLRLSNPESHVTGISISDLYWGDLSFPLFNPEHNIIVDMNDLDTDFYWVVNKCRYGKHYDPQSTTPFSFRSMELMSFYVDDVNLGLCAKTTEDKKIVSINLADIVFCLTDPSNPLARVAYPLRNPIKKKTIPIVDTNSSMFQIIFQFVKIGIRVDIISMDTFLLRFDCPMSSIIDNVHDILKSYVCYGSYIRCIVKIKNPKTIEVNFDRKSEQADITEMTVNSFRETIEKAIQRKFGGHYSSRPGGIRIRFDCAISAVIDDFNKIIEPYMTSITVTFIGSNLIDIFFHNCS